MFLDTAEIGDEHVADAAFQSLLTGEIGGLFGKLGAHGRNEVSTDLLGDGLLNDAFGDVFHVAQG
jgi:hypothetical protein